MEIYFFKVLNSFGINVAANSSPFVLIFCSVLVLAVIALLSVINISIYLLTYFILENKNLINKISKWKLLIRVLNLYKKTRVGFIIFELLLFIYCQSIIIYISYRLVTSGLVI